MYFLEGMNCRHQEGLAWTGGKRCAWCQCPSGTGGGVGHRGEFAFGDGTSLPSSWKCPSYHSAYKFLSPLISCGSEHADLMLSFQQVPRKRTQVAAHTEEVC